MPGYPWSNCIVTLTCSYSVAFPVSLIIFVCSQAACCERAWCTGFNFHKVSQQCDLSNASYGTPLNSSDDSNPYHNYQLHRACQSHHPPENGGTGNCSTAARSFLAHGDTCLYTCNTGYTISGVTNCSYGTLHPASCVGDECSLSAENGGIPANGNLGNCSMYANASMLTGAACVPGCNSGYHIKDGVEKLLGTKDVGYRGFQTRTRSGKTCQDWASQSPHKHTNTPRNLPTAGLDSPYRPLAYSQSNFCRNPDNTDTIWCYPSDNTTREYCDPRSGETYCRLGILSAAVCEEDGCDPNVTTVRMVTNVITSVLTNITTNVTTNISTNITTDVTTENTTNGTNWITINGPRTLPNGTITGCATVKTRLGQHWIPHNTLCTAQCNTGFDAVGELRCRLGQMSSMHCAPKDTRSRLNPNPHPQFNRHPKSRVVALRRVRRRVLSAHPSMRGFSCRMALLAPAGGIAILTMEAPIQCYMAALASMSVKKAMCHMGPGLSAGLETSMQPFVSRSGAPTHYPSPNPNSS